MPSLITEPDSDEKVPEYTAGTSSSFYFEIDLDAKKPINPERGQICKLLDTDSFYSDVNRFSPDLNKYNLKKITVKSGEKIYPYAFAGLNVEQYILPDTITEISRHSFCCNDLLAEIIIPENVVMIDENAFESCKSLSDVTIWNNIKEIGEDAFIISFASSPDIHFHGTPEEWNDVKKYWAFFNETVHYINSNENQSEINNDLSESSVIYKGSLGENIDYSFYDNGCLIISGSGRMNDFDSCPFEFRPDIKHVSFDPSSAIENIGQNTFFNCYSLEYAELPVTITEVGNSAFKYCQKLKNIDLSNIKVIGDDAFSDCKAMTNLKISDKLSHIGKWAFAFTHPNYVFYNGTEEKWNDFISERKESLFSPSSMRFAEPSKFLMTVGTDVVSPSVLEARRGCGDVNDDDITDLTDLTCLSMYLLKDYDLTAGGKVYSDITSDGDVDIADLAALKTIIMNG